MPRLILFRHAKTERAGPGEADLDRDLTERGHKDAAAMGAYLASHRLLPSHALVSPARRTQQTWEILSRHLTPAPHAATDQRIYEASPERLFRIVETASPETAALMIVGHNPGLHELALALTATGDIDARAQLREKLPTAGLVVIDFAFKTWRDLHPQSGRLERFVSPQSLSGEG